ncbi:Uncharacterised protein [Mycobacteroides abscessus subsp. abscessus]|nr:Uncharacterised protein [Mycobacteroides abscessus subsp. abscessus]
MPRSDWKAPASLRSASNLSTAALNSWDTFVAAPGARCSSFMSSPDSPGMDAPLAGRADMFVLHIPLTVAGPIWFHLFEDPLVQRQLL